MTDQANKSDLRRVTPVGSRRCPVCRKPAQADTRPFCSRRCADVDLSRWIGGVYRIPVNPADEEDGDPLGTAEAGPDRDGE